MWKKVFILRDYGHILWDLDLKLSCAAAVADVNREIILETTKKTRVREGFIQNRRKINSF